MKSILGCMSHQATLSVAVLDSGKVVMESILETKAATVLWFLRDCAELYRRPWATWLYDLLKPHIDVVCNPRKNVLLKDGNKGDRIDGRKLAELLRGNQLKPFYHGPGVLRMMLWELCRKDPRSA